MELTIVLIKLIVFILVLFILYKVYKIFSIRNRVDIVILAGNRKCERPYKNWKLHGEAKLFHANGKIARIEQFKYGIPIYPILTFDEEGNEDLKIFQDNIGDIETEKHYKQDILVYESKTKSEGIQIEEWVKTYQINGVIKRDEYSKKIKEWGFAEKRIEGRYLEYDEYGLLESELNIKNEKWRNVKFYFAGKIRKEENWFDTQREGIFSKYNDKGILREQFLYHNNQIVSKRRYYKNGNLHYQTPMFYNKYDELIGSKNGPNEYYYKNGNKRYIGYLKDGKNEGIVETFRKNGIKKTKTSYCNGIKSGIEKIYNRNGFLKLEISYKNNKKDGIFKTYRQHWFDWIYPEVSTDMVAIESEVPYKNGIIDGVAKTYYDDESIKSEVVFENGIKINVKKYEKGEKTLSRLELMKF